MFWYETILLPLLLFSFATTFMIITNVYKSKLLVIITAIAGIGSYDSGGFNS